MRLGLIILIILSIPHFGIGQILDLSNAKKEREIDTIPYDSSFLNFRYDTPLEVRAGLVGQKVFIGNIIYSQLTDMSGNFLSFEIQDSRSNRSYRISSFINQSPEIHFILKDNYGVEFIFNPGEYHDNWYLVGSLQKITEEFVNESFKSNDFKPFEMESETGEIFTIGEAPIKINDIQYAKLEDGYALVVIFENGLISKVELDINDQSQIEIGNRTYHNINSLPSTTDNVIGNVGGGLATRGLIFEPSIDENFQKSGKVVVRVCVNQKGEVIEGKYTQKGSTTTDSDLVNVAIEGAKRYKFSNSAIDRQCGTITVEFSPQNDDSAKETTGEGLGEYDDSGDGVFGRRVTYRDKSMISNAKGKSGKITFKVCINRRGIVTYVEIINGKTTIKDKSVLKQALSALQNYKYEPDFSAAKEQCGNYTLKIDNFQGIRD